VGGKKWDMLNTVKAVHNVCKSYSSWVVMSLSMNVKITSCNDWTLVQSEYLEVGCQFCEECLSDGGGSWSIHDKIKDSVTGAGDKEANRLECGEAASWVDDAARNTVSDDSCDTATRTASSRRVDVSVAGWNATAQCDVAVCRVPCLCEQQHVEVELVDRVDDRGRLVADRACCRLYIATAYCAGVTGLTRRDMRLPT